MSQITKQITVILGCLIKDDKVLLTQRTEKEAPEAHLRWELPGGKVDFGEIPEEALRREFVEETGINIEVANLLPHVEVSYWDYPWGKQQTLLLCFSCKYVSEGITSKDHHVENIAWIPLKDVQGLATLPGVNQFIELALSGKK